MSQPSETDIQQIFDRIAPVYDRFNDLLSLGQHRIWKKMALRWCEPQQGRKMAGSLLWVGRYDGSSCSESCAYWSSNRCGTFLK